MVAAQRTTFSALRGGTPQDQEADAEGLAEGAEWLGRESAEEEDAAWEGEDTLGDQMQVLKATSAARRLRRSNSASDNGEGDDTGTLLAGTCQSENPETSMGHAQWIIQGKRGVGAGGARMGTQDGEDGAVLHVETLEEALRASNTGVRVMIESGLQSLPAHIKTIAVSEAAVLHLRGYSHFGDSGTHSVHGTLHEYLCACRYVRTDA